MARYRRYNFLMASVVMALVITIGVIMQDVRTLNGGLTRIGGYLESDYGPRLPDTVFEPSLFDMTRSLAGYDKPFDVVVYGDSFSTSTRRGWANTLAARTGLSILVIHWSAAPLKRVLASPIFRSDPPRLLILQTVERAAIRRLVRIDRLYQRAEHDAIGASLSGKVPDTIPVESSEAVTQVAARSPLSWSRRVEIAVGYARKSLLREALGINTTRVVKVRITQPALFSHRAQDFMLLLDTDWDKQAVTTDEIVSARRGLERLRQDVEANGITHFRAMIFPDKLTCYGPYLEDPDLRCSSVIPRLEQAGGSDLIRIDKPLVAAIERGVVDVYYPHDTHTSAIGYKIAADYAFDHLVAAGVFEVTRD
ncbi:MAG: hypothetical protein AAF581_19950 [Planctomycetota bacterium]